MIVIIKQICFITNIIYLFSMILGYLKKKKTLFVGILSSFNLMKYCVGFCCGPHLSLLYRLLVNLPAAVSGSLLNAQMYRYR